MKKFSFILPIIVLICSICFSGCTSGSVSLFITNYPNKIVYEVNEKIDFSGLKVECLNTDGTTTRVILSDEDISSQDTSLPGEKLVTINKNDIVTTFKIYVANSVVEDKAQLKNVIKNSNDGDIIYIKKGEYKPENSQDESLYNIVIDKKLTIIGDGKDKTILHGNFLFGVNETENAYVPLENFEGVTILNIGFKLNSVTQNGYNNFEGPYGNYDNFGAIKTYNSKKVTVKNCLFDGYSYGINCDDISNLNVSGNYFKNIKICGLKVNNSITNSTITKNVFIDIGKNSLVYSNGVQGNVCAMHLSFNKEENAGVIVASNNMARVGLLDDKLIFANNGANELELNGVTNFTNGFYVNNSSLILLTSSTTNNLNVNGIIITNNNYGKTLKNISFNSNKDNFINQSGVIIN